MKIYTLNVGQGQFVVVAGKEEAIIVDTSIKTSSDAPTEFVKGALVNILEKKKLIGVLITGFDDDHFNEIGVKIALNKYRPNWIMYPKYFKKTGSADAAFAAIREHQGKTEIPHISILLVDNKARFYKKGYSEEFSFEVFSPHAEDKSSSNNLSLVCKIKEIATGATYLVTGDAEGSRWDGIVKLFKEDLKSDVLAAPHHGSRNGITNDAMKAIKPRHVIISAGVDNQYEHPHKEALDIFKSNGASVYRTNEGKGQSLVTEIGTSITTAPYSSLKP